MKTIVVILALSSLAFACPEGTIPYEGNCAADLVPEKAVQTIKASDEKPPAEKMPSYQREGIHAEMPSSEAAKDVLADEEKAKAETEGKAHAGLLGLPR